jgi:adenylate kinase family enzyme
VQRVLVVGMSGAGKSTAARRLAARLDLPFHEMDTLALGPGWSTPSSFVDDVAAVLRDPSWVFDSWGYAEVRDAMWAAADTVVWLDYPRRVVLPRVLRRSWRRSWTGEPIFGGNVEGWRGWLSREHPAWHAVTTFGERRRYLAARTVRETHLTTVRLRHPQEWQAWLASLQASRS